MRVTATGRTKRHRRTRSETPEVKLSLVVHGFACQPEEITKILGIEPTKTGRRGEPVVYAHGIASKTQKKENSWVLGAPASDSLSLADHLDSLVGLLTSAIPKFVDLPKGSSVTLSCAVYDYERRVILEFSNAALTALAWLGADITMDYYDLTDWED